MQETGHGTYSLSSIQLTDHWVIAEPELPRATEAGNME
jgi:hypothetical protein